MIYTWYLLRSNQVLANLVGKMPVLIFGNIAIIPNYFSFVLNLLEFESCFTQWQCDNELEFFGRNHWTSSLLARYRIYHQIYNMIALKRPTSMTSNKVGGKANSFITAQRITAAVESARGQKADLKDQSGRKKKSSQNQQIPSGKKVGKKEGRGEKKRKIFL